MNDPTEEQRQKTAVLLKQASERLRSPEYKDMALLLAREAFERFTASRKAGFDAGQALQIAIQLWGK